MRSADRWSRAWIPPLMNKILKGTGDCSLKKKKLRGVAQNSRRLFIFIFLQLFYIKKTDLSLRGGNDKGSEKGFLN